MTLKLGRNARNAVVATLSAVHSRATILFVLIAGMCRRAQRAPRSLSINPLQMNPRRMRRATADNVGPPASGFAAAEARGTVFTCRRVDRSEDYQALTDPAGRS